MTDFSSITNALIAGDSATVTRLVKEAVDQDGDANEILNTGLIHGMDIVGEKMQNGDMFIPEVLMCARTMGEAPVNQEFADEIGADGYAPDAGSASKIAKQLCA